MKPKLTFILALLSLFMGLSPVSAKWVYAGSFPWIWDTTNGWSYLPEKSEMVWNAGEKDWILNPYGDPVDLRGIDSRSRWWLELSNGANLWTLVLYPSTSDDTINGPFLLFDDQVFDLYNLEYTMMVNELNGTVLLHVEIDSKGVTANFSLLLDFMDLEQGTYRLTGGLPDSASDPTKSVQLKGNFLLK